MQKHLVDFGIKHTKNKGLQRNLSKRTPSLGLLLPLYQLFQHHFSSNKKNHFEK